MADAFKIGGMGTDVLTGRTIRILATLQGALLAGGKANFQLAGANYQVPGGVSYYITAFHLVTGAIANGAGYIEIRYADDAALTTNPVTIINGIAMPIAQLTTTPVYPCGQVQAPTGKYVGIWNPSGATTSNSVQAVVWGYEG